MIFIDYISPVFRTIYFLILVVVVCPPGHLVPFDVLQMRPIQIILINRREKSRFHA